MQGNLTPLLQKMERRIEELKQNASKSQKLREKINCCRIENCFY